MHLHILSSSPLIQDLAAFLSPEALSEVGHALRKLIIDCCVLGVLDADGQLQT